MQPKYHRLSACLPHAARSVIAHMMRLASSQCITLDALPSSPMNGESLCRNTGSCARALSTRHTCLFRQHAGFSFPPAHPASCVRGLRHSRAGRHSPAQRPASSTPAAAAAAPPGRSRRAPRHPVPEQATPAPPQSTDPPLQSALLPQNTGPGPTAASTGSLMPAH